MNPKTTTSQPGGVSPRTKPKAAPCPCGGCGSPGCTCCQTISFERPNYFCGQLLSDADLHVGLTYIREKNKLYHRTLHGYGVVCGLRLTCDPDCCGSIRIGEGFAIDNCGNDLVVCQSLPFDVITALKAKDWLITEPPEDPCKDETRPRCKVKQCFYVTICYDEEEAEFTTPFKTKCGPGAAACEPTRIRETVRFDILECPPKVPTCLDEIEERINCCTKLFTEGPLGRALQRHFPKDWSPRKEGVDYCQVFCELKVLFQHHLQRWPDRYDCTLADQVCHLQCPTDDRDNTEGRGDFECCQEALCELFKLIMRYVIDCILGEMIFPCPCPHEAHCVGLGTVAVEDGKVVRVCNCPRHYVLTFANLCEVLLATLVGGFACAPAKKDENTESEKSPCKKECEPVCCATFDPNCEQFLALFTARPNFFKLAAAAPVHSMRRLMESLKAGFNFTDAMAFSPKIFEGMAREEAEVLARKLTGRTEGVVLELFGKPKLAEAADPFAAVLSYLLKRPGDPLAATLTDVSVAAWAASALASAALRRSSAPTACKTKLRDPESGVRSQETLTSFPC
jgi:hypothetical protein